MSEFKTTKSEYEPAEWRKILADRLKEKANEFGKQMLDLRRRELAKTEKAKFENCVLCGHDFTGCTCLKGSVLSKAMPVNMGLIKNDDLLKADLCKCGKAIHLGKCDTADIKPLKKADDDAAKERKWHADNAAATAAGKKGVPAPPRGSPEAKKLKVAGNWESPGQVGGPPLKKADGMPAAANPPSATPKPPKPPSMGAPAKNPTAVKAPAPTAKPAAAPGIPVAKFEKPVVKAALPVTPKAQALQHGLMAGSKAAVGTKTPSPAIKLPSQNEHAARQQMYSDFMPKP